MWARKRAWGNTSKYHLIDDGSLEEREVEIGYGEPKKKIKQHFAHLHCGSKQHRDYCSPDKYDDKWNRYVIGPLRIRNQINILQNNVCAYCRNYVFKQEGIEAKILK